MDSGFLVLRALDSFPVTWNLDYRFRSFAGFGSLVEIYGRPNVSKFAKLKFIVAILNSLSLNSNSLSLT